MSYDVCVIGSGAGGGPVAFSLAQKGYRVLVLEKGPRYARTQFLKDEVIQQRRPTLKPNRDTDPMVLQWRPRPTDEFSEPEITGSWWNGNLVGGSSELMSGFMMRLKPRDFRLRSELGPVEGATVADWPISYDELEPWYAKAEQLVGISGELRDLPPHLRDKRSTKDFPQPPTREHPFAGMLDRTCKKIGLHAIKLPRAVLSQTDRAQYPDRRACDYNGYCGSYACYQGAKGASGAAFLPRAEATGRCDIIARAMVTRLETDDTGKRVVRAEYVDRHGKRQTVEAGVFIVACQAVESARLLLKSANSKHPKGLANASGQVGRNFVSSAFGAGWGEFDYASHPELRASTEPFVNRVVQDYYVREGLNHNGGTLNFLLMHPNPIGAATYQSFWDMRGRVKGNSERIPLWGPALKTKLAHYFTQVEHLKYEVFGEWLPNPGCYVTLDKKVKDQWGEPVVHIYRTSHPDSITNARFLLDKGNEILEAMGATNIREAPVYATPSTNLLAGTCRFGDDPQTSVLDRDCKAHDVDNLYVTDGSFMPTGGTVPFTFTIYANALRVADTIAKRLG